MYELVGKSKAPSSIEDEDDLSGFRPMTTKQSSFHSAQQWPSIFFQNCNWIVVIVLVTILSGLTVVVWSIISWYTNGGCTYAPSCGTILATYQGIPAYSNGKYQCLNTDCSSHVQTGRQFQCVEFVQRYLQSIHGIDPNDWKNDNADQMCSIRPSRVKLTSSPKPGDLFVSKSTSPGHVAIISKVNWLSVDVVEQNASPTGEGSYYKYSAQCFLTVVPDK